MNFDTLGIFFIMCSADCLLYASACVRACVRGVQWHIWVILARCRSFGFEAAKFRIGLIIIILCFA